MQKLSSFSYTLRSLIEHQDLIRPLLFSSFASSPPNFLPSYLVTKCGFSLDKAAEVSKLLCRVKSPDQPDSVMAFFKSVGFDDSQVRKLFQLHPRLLARGVDKFTAPKVRMLQNIGINGMNLVNMIMSNPRVLDLNIKRNFIPKFELWKRNVVSDKLLMKSLKEKMWISASHEKLLKNISFLRAFGLSDRQISFIMTKRPQIIALNPESLNQLISRVESLGMPRGSPNFHMALYALSNVREDNLQGKMEMFKGFGWSEDDFAKAFCNSPIFITTSLKMFEKKMELLVKEAGYHASYIAFNPYVLSLSLEKRLVSRVKVLKALKEKGLSGGNHKLTTAMKLTNDKFFERYVAPYKETVPKLSQLLSASS